MDVATEGNSGERYGAYLGTAVKNLLRPEFKARELVTHYFDIQKNTNFAGTSFDNLGRPKSTEDENRFTSHDLLALCMLDVRPRPEAIRQFASGDLHHLLEELTPGTPLWEADEPLLAAVERVWTRLKAIPHFGPTSVSKLLSRKRPKLVPIQDSLIRDLLKVAPDASWHRPLSHVLKSEETRQEIDTLWSGPQDGRPSTLRLLDVAMWMLASNSQAAKRARNRHLGSEDKLTHSQLMGTR